MWEMYWRPVPDSTRTCFVGSLCAVAQSEHCHLFGRTSSSQSTNFESGSGVECRVCKPALSECWVRVTKEEPHKSNLVLEANNDLAGDDEVKQLGLTGHIAVCGCFGSAIRISTSKTGNWGLGVIDPIQHNASFTVAALEHIGGYRGPGEVCR